MQEQRKKSYVLWENQLHTDLRSMELSFQPVRPVEIHFVIYETLGTKNENCLNFILLSTTCLC